MKRICRVLPIILGLVAGAGCPAPGPRAPPADRCDQPVVGSADAVEIGAASADELGGDLGPFVPLADGDHVTVVRGGQGASMVGWRLRLTGSGVADCLEQHLEATGPQGERGVASSSTPLRTYVEADGSHTTRPLWVPGYYDDDAEFLLTVTTAGQAITRRLRGR